MELNMKDIMNKDIQELKLDYIRVVTENEMMRSQLMSVLAERNVLFQKQTGVVLPEQKQNNQNQQKQNNQPQQSQGQPKRESEFIVPQGVPRSVPPNQNQQRPVIEKPKIVL
jgi:hypothetical protein